MASVFSFFSFYSHNWLIIVTHPPPQHRRQQRQQKRIHISTHIFFINFFFCYRFLTRFVTSCNFFFFCPCESGVCALFSVPRPTAAIFPQRHPRSAHRHVLLMLPLFSRGGLRICRLAGTSSATRRGCSFFFLLLLLRIFASYIFSLTLWKCILFFLCWSVYSFVVFLLFSEKGLPVLSCVYWCIQVNAPIWLVLRSLVNTKLMHATFLKFYFKLAQDFL